MLLQILGEVSGADLVVKKLDLSSLDSVRECARDINETESRLDILVNNAGEANCHRSTTNSLEFTGLATYLPTMTSALPFVTLQFQFYFLRFPKVQ